MSIYGVEKLIYLIEDHPELAQRFSSLIARSILAIARLIDAGLDSLRVSLNSTQEIYYNRYYRPNGYSFADVQTSIQLMKEAGRFVSLNYFILPGVTDSEKEFAALCRLVESCRPDFIQLRNLNMDPEWYFRSLEFPRDEPAMGIRNWLQTLQQTFPPLRFGYFNPYLENGAIHQD